MITVSIIIPVYKTEKYLAQCMDSILCQEGVDLEIILVDDGSPDACPRLCDEYAAKHSNVRVIHQANQGQGMSRNAGMDAATGKYLFFMDSDDCLDGTRAIATLLEVAEKEQADITQGSFRRFGDWGISEPNHHHLRAGEYCGTVDFRFKGFYMYGHLAYNWGKLYRREFLLQYDLRSKPYPFTQDKAHNMCCYAYKPIYAFTDDSVYLYRVNEESVTFKYKENYSPVWISIASEFQDFLDERGIQEDYRDLMGFHIFFGSFFLAKQELQFQKHGIRAAAKALKAYGKDSFVKARMKELAKGKYLKEIEPVSWKLVIWAASLVFCMHGYYFMAAGIAMLRNMQIDKKISNKRYEKVAVSQYFSPEEQYLMDLLHQALQKDSSSIQEKPGELNIAVLLTKARKHAVLSLLYDVWKEQSPLQECLSVIEQDSRQIVMQSYRLLFLTKYVVNLLQKAGIPVAVLKGVATAGMYPVPELRKSGDVDLLVPETVTNKQLCTVMEKAGFRVSGEQHANHHLAFVSPEGINVEIHTMLAEPFAYKEVNRAMEKHMRECMQYVHCRDIMGVQLPILDRPYHAYELLLHMLQHFVYAGFGLKLLCDWVVMWQQDWTVEEKALFTQLVTDSGLRRFTEVITEVCAKFLGLNNKCFAWDFTIEPVAEEFLREILDAEEFGNSDNSRMVMMSGTGLFALVKEFHHHMQLNFPKAGKCFLFWPVLWVITLVRFLRNNRKVRNTSASKVLKEATRRSRLMGQLKLFE